MKIIDSAIIPAAGLGKRIAGYSSTIPKPMIRVNDRPILEYTIHRAKRMGVSTIYLIVGKKGKAIREYFEDGSAFDLEIQYLLQEEPLGIGMAILLAKDFIKNRFAVLLGDEIYINSNHDEMVSTFTTDTNSVIGLMRTNNPEMIKRNYTVSISEENQIDSLEEKPSEITNDILGVGSYLFDNLLFDAIAETPIGKKGEIEITDSINTLCQINAVVKPFFLSGHYLNVTYPEDIEYATQLIRKDPIQSHL